MAAPAMFPPDAGGRLALAHYFDPFPLMTTPSPSAPRPGPPYLGKRGPPSPKRGASTWASSSSCKWPLLERPARLLAITFPSFVLPRLRARYGIPLTKACLPHPLPNSLYAALPPLGLPSDAASTLLLTPAPLPPFIGQLPLRTRAPPHLSSARFGGGSLPPPRPLPSRFLPPVPRRALFLCGTHIGLSPLPLPSLFPRSTGGALCLALRL